MVVGLVDQHLGLVHQPAKSRGMSDAIAIALVEGAERVRVFGITPAAALPGTHGIRSETLPLAFQPIRRFEQVGHQSKPYTTGLRKSFSDLPLGDHTGNPGLAG